VAKRELEKGNRDKRKQRRNGPEKTEGEGEQEMDIEEVIRLVKKFFPEVQIQRQEGGKIVGLVRMHTVTLVSSGAHQVVYVRPIPGETNEEGAMPDLIEALYEAYGKTDLFKMVTTDAGNNSLAAAEAIVSRRWEYCLQIKEDQRELLKEAKLQLGTRSVEKADFTCADIHGNEVVTYVVFVHPLGEAGWLNWSHARVLVRVVRITQVKGGSEERRGERYYVCSCALKPAQLLRIIRSHWRCENNTHWTNDVFLHEDVNHRHQWTNNPRGIVVMAILRALALNILALLRYLSRLPYTYETPSWRTVINYLVTLLCTPILDTEAFNKV